MEESVLEAIRISNFQAHEKLEIEFGNTTTIVGPSDAGKSAILRALLWTLSNSPTGEAFRRWGSSSTKVSVKIDGQLLSRVRSNSENKYRLNGGDYKSFGSGVPESISRLVGIGGLSIARQHDSPFWFGMSPGDVAKEINAIVDLGIIDTAIEKISSKARRAKVEAEVAEDRKRSAEADLAALAFVPEMGAAFDAALAAGKAAVNARREADAVLGAVIQANQAKEAAQERRGAADSAAGVITAGDAALALAASLRVLRGVIATARVWEKKAARPVPDLSPLIWAADEARAAEGTRARLTLAVGGVRLAADLVENCRMKAEKAEAKLREETQGRCPICGGDLPAGNGR